MRTTLLQQRPSCRVSWIARRHCRTARRTVVRAVGEPPSQGQPDESSPDAQKQLLERLFYSSAPADSSIPSEEVLAGGQEAGALEDAGPELPGVIRDLPLWRVQWAALPGYQEVLHVHVPHYADMLSRLLAQPRPWRFGHLYLPQGSANLGNPDYALVPGGQAPLVGTLMEILQAVRFPDGRLLVLAVGLGRFKVVRAWQTVPHSRADVVLLPDWEEVQRHQELALDALEAGANADLPVSAAMQASIVAAEQAAGAAAQVWWRYEVAAAAAEARRGRQSAAGIISASNEDEARAFGKRLVTIGNTPVAPLPMHGSGLAEEEGEWPSDSEDEEGLEGDVPSAGTAPAPSAAAAAVAVSAGSPGASPSGQGQQQQGSYRESTDCAAIAAEAEAAALEAACKTIQALSAGAAAAAAAEGAAGSGQPPAGGLGLGLGAWSGALGETALAPGLSVAHASSGLLTGINSTADRGVPSLPAPPEEEPWGAREAEDPGGGGGVSGSRGREPSDDIGAGASRSVALRLEELTWRELDAVCHLAARIRRQRVPLGEGVDQLRPPGLAPAAVEGGEDGGAPALPAGSLHPAYPPARRAQRLSYALASILGDLTGGEGRQALLEASSTSARLRLGLAALRRHRSVLAAVVAVQGLRKEGE